MWLMKFDFKSDKSLATTESENLICLNLGCGNKKLPGFINIDERDIPGIEYPLTDIRSLTMFTDNSIDYIYVCHVLEHFPRSDTFSVLKEWNRVLKPNGLIRISVPDWDAIVNHYLETQDLENVLNLLYGARGEEEKNELAHKRIFNFANLRALLYEAGFKRICRYTFSETFHASIDDYANAHIPHMDFENGKLVSLNLEASK